MSGKVYLPNISYEIRRPAIIAQKKKKNIGKEEKLDSLLQQEIDQDLASEFQVRNGMLVVAPAKPSLPGPSSANTPRLVVVNSSNSNRPLPGTADEVESYPCRVCNRVFLTDKGLQKHAEQAHPEHLRKINEDIQDIMREWKRRELHNAVKKNLPITKNRKNISRNPKSPGVYEVCNVCETMVKLDTPDAFEEHKQKHLSSGDITEPPVQCTSCSMSFASQDSYMKHLETHRKRSFVCRFCGSRFPSFVELRKHKVEFHEYKLTSSQGTKDSQRLSSFRKPLNASIKHPEASRVKTTCDACGLSFHKIDLLIRHVATTHQTRVFQAKITVAGLPTYSISVQNLEIKYHCCHLLFTDKDDFHHHRQSHSLIVD